LTDYAANVEKIHFLRNGYRFGMQVFIVWLGQNLINIGVYAADARAHVLPLLGKGTHDWSCMLGTLGLLEHDAGIGHVFFGLGILAFVIALLLPLKSGIETV